MESIKTFSQNLKREKELSGISILELADKCGYCPQAVFDTLNGVRNPRLNTAVCIAEVLNCSMDALLEHCGMRYYTEKQTPSERLKELRHKKKISIKKLSEKAGVLQNTIWRFENNKHDISLGGLMKLAKVLDFSIDWLVGK